MSLEATDYTGQTACGNDTRSPLRDFLRTETGRAAVLATAALAALAWANAAPATYEAFWHTDLSVRLGPHAISLDLREWVNSGLMTLFFLVVGLEARREFDMGELRERKRLALPLAAGLTVTLGILIAYALGKPLGIVAASALTTLGSRGRIRLPVGWGATATAGTLSGVGFTVSLLIATLAFDGPRLDEAKIGILGTRFSPL